MAIGSPQWTPGEPEITCYPKMETKAASGVCEAALRADFMVGCANHEIQYFVRSFSMVST
jgi:hypothetical protein